MAHERWRNDRATTAQRLRNDRATTARRLRNDRATTAQRPRNDRATTAQRPRSDRATTAQRPRTTALRLRYDCLTTALRLPCDCRTTAVRPPYDCRITAGRPPYDCLTTAFNRAAVETPRMRVGWGCRIAREYKGKIRHLSNTKKLPVNQGGFGMACHRRRASARAVGKSGRPAPLGVSGNTPGGIRSGSLSGCLLASCGRIWAPFPEYRPISSLCNCRLHKTPPVRSMADAATSCVASGKGQSGAFAPCCSWPLRPY